MINPSKISLGINNYLSAQKILKSLFTEDRRSQKYQLAIFSQRHWKDGAERTEACREVQVRKTVRRP